MTLGLALLSGYPAALAMTCLATLAPSAPARKATFGTGRSMQSPTANTLPVPGASFTSRLSST